MTYKLLPHKLGTLLVIAGLMLSLSASIFAQSEEVEADAANTEQADGNTASKRVFLPLMQNDASTDVIANVITSTLPEAENLSPAVEAAALSAATICPPRAFPNTINRALNPSFETLGANGSPTSCRNGCQVSSPSAAANWTMHSNNVGAPVSPNS